MQTDASGMQTDAPIHSIPIHSIPIHNTRESIADKPPSSPAPTKQAKKSFGEFGWVKLTSDEFNRLINDLGEAEVNRCIAYVDESAQTTNNKNKWRDWNLVIRKCSRDRWGVSAANGTKKPSGNPWHSADKPIDPMIKKTIERMMAEVKPNHPSEADGGWTEDDDG
jgi:hypothetical protein